MTEAEIIAALDELIVKATSLPLRDVLPTLHAMRLRLEGAVDGITEAMER